MSVTEDLSLMRSLLVVVELAVIRISISITCKKNFLDYFNKSLICLLEKKLFSALNIWMNVNLIQWKPELMKYWQKSKVPQNYFLPACSLVMMNHVPENQFFVYPRILLTKLKCIGRSIWIVTKVNECCVYVFGVRNFSLQIYAGNVRTYWFLE